MKRCEVSQQASRATLTVDVDSPLQFLLLTISGWMTRDHQRVTDYLLAENAVLRERLRGRQSLSNKLIVPMNENAANSGRACADSGSVAC